MQVRDEIAVAEMPASSREVGSDRAVAAGSKEVETDREVSARNDYNVTWELVFDEEEAQPVMKQGIEKTKITNPSMTVASVHEEPVKAMKTGIGQGTVITVEADPVKQVQAVRYAQAQAGILEDHEVLEVRMEPDLPRQVETVAYQMPLSGIAEEEVLEISRDEEPIVPVQLVRYAASMDVFPWAEEELELRMEPAPEMQVEQVMYAYQEPLPAPADEALEVTPAVAPAADSGGNTVPASSARHGHHDHLSSLTASNSGLLSFPEPVAVPMATEGSYADLVQRALTAPDALTYEELLFAASMVTDPGNKLKIYNVAFIRSERDWRAYYNASIAARDGAKPELAEVYMYQAGLIYDDALVGQVDRYPAPVGLR